MKQFHRDGINFAYREEGDGVAFVFQHGLGGDAAQTFAFFPEPHPFHLLTLECRAHGTTEPLGPEEDLSFNTFADDVIAVMDHAGIDRAIVGGISMGAGVSLNIALRYPERLRALILSRPAWEDAPLPKSVSIFPWLASLIRAHGAKGGLEAFRQSAEYQKIIAHSPDNIAALESQFLNPRAEETVAKLERIPNDAPNCDRCEWAAIKVPTLVIANELDLIHPISYAQTLADNIPGAVLREVTAKSVNIDQHTVDVRTEILAFLTENGVLTHA